MTTLDILEKLFVKYNLNENDKEYFISIVKDIIEHDEFIKRTQGNYLHHEKIYLGEHILNDAVVTYILGKKIVVELMKKHSLTMENVEKNLYDPKTAIIIAMFHDLYTLPWQNNKKNNYNKYFVNAHGFRHPIEAVINAYTWFPKLFEGREDKIIDGIIHHMYPFPVRVIDDKTLELKNDDNYKTLPQYIKQKIIKSANRRKLGHLSICPCIYLEGKTVSKADKIVSFRNEGHSIIGLLACVTGKKTRCISK